MREGATASERSSGSSSRKSSSSVCDGESGCFATPCGCISTVPRLPSWHCPPLNHHFQLEWYLLLLLPLGQAQITPPIFRRPHRSPSRYRSFSLQTHAWFLGFKEKPKPKPTCINARRWDPKIHSITMSVSASTARQGWSENGKATQASALPSTFWIGYLTICCT